MLWVLRWVEGGGGMFVCMYICTQIILTCMLVSKETYTSVKRDLLFVCTYVRKSVLRACTHACTQGAVVMIHTCMHTHIYACMHTHAYTHRELLLCMHACIHTYMQAHTQGGVLFSSHYHMIIAQGEVLFVPAP